MSAYSIHREKKCKPESCFYCKDEKNVVNYHITIWKPKGWTPDKEKDSMKDKFFKQLEEIK